jgi:hypothetical protein
VITATQQHERDADDVLGQLLSHAGGKTPDYYQVRAMVAETALDDHRYVTALVMDRWMTWMSSQK